jgi:DNA-binding transcriptional LysR family regulator
VSSRKEFDALSCRPGAIRGGSQHAQLQPGSSGTRNASIDTVTTHHARSSRELGFRISFIRSTRTFKLTEAGQACYEQSKALVAEARRIQEDVTGIAVRASGHIRVGVPFDLAQTIFLPLFARYMLDHPEISIEVLSISGHREPSDRKPRYGDHGGTSSCACPIHLSRPGASAHSLAACLPLRNIWPGTGGSRTPQNSPRTRAFVVFTESHVSQWELRREREHRTVKVGGTASANSVGMLARLSKEGMGIALLPDFLALHPGFGDGLVRVLSDWEAVPAHIFAVTPSAMQSARVRKLVSFLKEHFEAMLTELSSRRKP